MLHELIEEGGVPYLYRETEEIVRELCEQKRICTVLRRLGEGFAEVTEGVSAEGSDLLLRLLGEAEELAGDLGRALAESERLYAELEEERRELMLLAGRI